MKTPFLLFVVVSLQFAPAAQAGVGSALFREGVEYVSKTLGKSAAKEAAEVTAKRAAQEGAEVVLRRAGITAFEASAKQAGMAAARAGAKAGQAAIRYGEAAGGFIRRFGDDAAEALVNVSSRNGRRLVMLEKELGTSGQAGALLKVVRENGDTAVEWLWANRKAVAAGVGATVLLTNPEAVLNAGSRVVTGALDAAGDSVVKPVTEGVMWLLTRLGLLVGLCAVGTYVLWLKSPASRSAITGVAKCISHVRWLRK